MTDILESGARGIRNNNPGNIRHTQDQWAGMASAQSDPEFVQFISPEFGIRAMAKILKNYMARGIVNLSQVISTWAPPTENNTQAYVADVARHSGLDPNSKLSAVDLPALIPAMIQHENGQQPYTAATIAKGISLS